MSAWLSCGQPRWAQTPFFHSTERGISGHAASPIRSGLTACQTST